MDRKRLLELAGVPLQEGPSAADVESKNLLAQYVKMQNIEEDDYENKDHMKDHMDRLEEAFYNLLTMPVNKAFELAKKDGWMWKRWQSLVHLAAGKD